MSIAEDQGPARPSDDTDQRRSENASPKTGDGIRKRSMAFWLGTCATLLGALMATCLVVRTTGLWDGAPRWDQIAVQGTILLLPALCLGMALALRGGAELSIVSIGYAILTGGGIAALQFLGEASTATDLLFLFVILPLCGAIAALALWKTFRRDKGRPA